MTSSHNLTRRAVLAALALLPLNSTVAATRERGEVRQAGSRTLVAYFSRSGNTRVAAGLIRRALNAHLLENIGAEAVRLTPDEFAELNQSVAAIQIRGARLPDAVLAFSGVEAPARK